MFNTDQSETSRGGVRVWLRRRVVGITVLMIGLLIVVGVFASNGWLPRTDAMTGQRYGWFGAKLAKNAPSSWNPLAAPDPSPTPQLSKEYIYAGSRLLAVEDKNANAAPPADLAVWRPTTGMWYVLSGQGSQPTSFPWGQENDVPVQGDYDGDGKTDFSIFRPETSMWWVIQSSDGTYFNVEFGFGDDKVVPADFDSDGRTDIAVWRPSTHHWYIRLSSTCTPNCTIASVEYGADDDIPAPADYDGDGMADVAVWRASEQAFYSRNSSNGADQYAHFDSSSDQPVSADYDGDGKTNYAIKHGADWMIMRSSLEGYDTTTWGEPDDIPVQNDYDSDGKCDIAVWHGDGGLWSILQSHDLSTRTEKWGLEGDIPVPAFYRRF